MKVPKEHQMNCNTCGQVMDLRDLSQVFAHEDCNGKPIDYDNMEQIPHNKGVKIEKPITWSNANWWNLPLN